MVEKNLNGVNMDSTSKLYLQMIDLEIKRLEKEKEKIKKASKFIEELERTKEERNKENEYLLEWQQGLKSRLLILGISQTELGNRINVSKQTIGKWVNLYKLIPKRRAKQISIYINYPLPNDIDFFNLKNKQK